MSTLAEPKVGSSSVVEASTAVDYEKVVVPEELDDDGASGLEMGEDGKRDHLEKQESHTSMDDDESDGALYKSMMRSRWSKKVVTTCPGIMVFFCGVLLPMFFLIFLAFVFGLWLARLEAPEEVAANDDILARTYLANRTRDSVVAYATNISRACLDSYAQDLPTDDFSPILNLVIQNRQTFLDENYVLAQEFSQSAHNYSEIQEYLHDCGEAGRSWVLSRFEEVNLAVVETGLGGLSFNWIRCYEGKRDLNVDLDGDILDLSEIKPIHQTFYYTTNWIRDYQRLQELYRDELRKSAGALTVEAVFDASNRALDEATGGDKCSLNGSGSAWFWFTVETTVGYGNQAPVSGGGRLLVFTAGFFSILAFGSLLATSGSVIAELTDRTFFQLHPSLARFSHPGWGSLYWGVLWGLWMFLIAYVTKKWKEIRLDEELGLGSAYWFSYITTTTVGLGDIFLEPEVIVGIDLLYFPLLFLVGFTLLSAFVSKLATLIAKHLMSGRRSFVDSVFVHVTFRNDTTSEAPETPESAPYDQANVHET
eukprot:CAMPEP_0172440536 /NCGR_PEP_ID=MMETSP1065-20121228/1163_1 /TAXON_ID=265537 /ORGANISM="Amphiprora paludosa, Strain CCMP125" /LENGTH=536 /DNA_ID=CAMNT_0013189429 /DNA_START=88 /DNA_END=1698 /DNA_ORIENTATION=-